jgi:hypothetical protein
LTNLQNLSRESTNALSLILAHDNLFLISLCHPLLHSSHLIICIFYFKNNSLVGDVWYGAELKQFTIRVLSLTCSATGYERNWSNFKQIHSKNRTYLEHEKNKI